MKGGFFMTKTKQLTVKISVSGMLIALYFVLDRLLAINLLTNKYNLSERDLLIYRKSYQKRKLYI